MQTASYCNQKIIGMTIDSGRSTIHEQHQKLKGKRGVDSCVNVKFKNKAIYSENGMGGAVEESAGFFFF